MDNDVSGAALKICSRDPSRPRERKISTRVMTALADSGVSRREEAGAVPQPCPTAGIYGSPGPPVLGVAELYGIWKDQRTHVCSVGKL